MGIFKCFLLLVFIVLFVSGVVCLIIEISQKVKNCIRIIKDSFSKKSKSAYKTDEPTHKTEESTKYKWTSNENKTPKFQKRRIFDVDANAYRSRDKTLYTAVLSVIALFSWVMRKDGTAGKQELEVARIYFKNHPIYNDILSFPPQNLINDPMTNTQSISSKDCMTLLKHYNTLPKLLRYGKCCENIMAANIYPNAALELLRILFQVAYSIDGVIESEMEILHGIAQGLKIRPENWNNLLHMYGTYRKTNRGKKSADQSDNEKGKKSHKKKKRKKGQNEDGSEGTSGQNEEQRSDQQNQQQKSSTFGYKLTQAYNELGLLTTATESEIKEAFRTLAKKYHPDHLPPEATDQERKISADQFRMVKEAYDLIRLERGR